MMNNDENFTGRASDGENEDENVSPGTAEIVRTGAEEGKCDAKESAKKFYGQVSNGLGKAAYGLSYYSAFGAAFAVALVKEAMPSKMREGFAEGVKAGGESGGKALSKVKDAVSKKKEDEPVAGDDAPLPESA